MSKSKLALIICLGLLLVAAVSYWSGRSHDADGLEASEFDTDEHEWAEKLEGIAGAMGGLLGQGPGEFDLDRLLAANGLSPIGDCDASGCVFRFSGSTQMRVLGVTGGDGGFARLYLRVSGPAEMRYEAASADYDEPPEATEVGQDTLVSVPVDEEGGRIFFLGCGRLEDDCTVRFSSREER